MSADVVELVRRHIDKVYVQLHEAERDALARKLLEVMGVGERAVAAASTGLPGADEVVLITYGDTFDDGAEPPIRTLRQVWNEHFAAVFSTVHVLPFFPSSSDGGFSVIDYRRVDERLGGWQDLAEFEGAHLMVDLVCNHGSAESVWFQNLLLDRDPGRDYYLTADPHIDLSLVTRPRTHPLLKQVETAAGTRHVWATFSHDQVDFDFSNPQVLVEFCAILGHYLDHGASRVRLDAVAYLWKEIGTRCVHLAQTHQIVKLMRTLVTLRDPDALLITETNVPHADNVSYFGQGDEAHVVYNFTLAPLIAWSLIAGRADRLTSWLQGLDPAPTGCSFLNFIASHDGLGLRPIEDLISPEDLAPLIEAAAQVGGSCSAYASADGDRPYELNVSLADLLAGPGGEHASRFLVAHAVMLALQGIPAFYVHSMLASPGELRASASSGIKRDINRGRVSVRDLSDRLAAGWRAEVFQQLSHLINLRRAQPAFAPTSAQQVHVLDERVLAIERRCDLQTVLALHNLSAEHVSLSLPAGYATFDLISATDLGRETVLEPFAAAWLTDASPGEPTRAATGSTSTL